MFELFTGRYDICLSVTRSFCDSCIIQEPFDLFQQLDNSVGALDGGGGGLHVTFSFFLLSPSFSYKSSSDSTL